MIVSTMRSLRWILPGRSTTGSSPTMVEETAVRHELGYDRLHRISFHFKLIHKSVDADPVAATMSVSPAPIKWE